MCFFKRKKKEETVVCNHKYKEVGIRCEYELKNGYTSPHHVLTYGSWICIHCKHHEERKLSTNCFDSYEKANNWYKELCKERKVKTALEINEEIANFQLVDAEYLEIYRKLFPDRNI